MSLLSVEDLTIALPPGADREHAVSGISFTVDPGEVLCIGLTYAPCSNA